MKKILKKEILHKKKRELLLILLAVMVLSITAVGYHLTFKDVTIVDGQEEIRIKTSKDTVQEVLEEQDISYIPQDAITPAIDTKVEDKLTITIKRAVNISIEADEKTYDLLTPVENVAAALEQAGIELGPKDEVRPSLTEPLKEGMEIAIIRAVGVTLKVDGEEMELMTTASTVEEIIEKAQITLEEKDKVSPSLDTAVEKGMEIKITRVTEETITETVDIDFKTIRKNSSSLYIGTTKVATKGQKGSKEQEVLVTYEDGEEVSRKVLEEKVIKEAVDQVVYVGTKAQPVSSRGDGEVVRTLTVVATAYSSQDPGVGTRTSLGVTLRKGVIAVDPTVIPYRTKIYVPGYGFGEALDSGGAIKGNKIDLAFDTRAEALQYGRRTVTIKIYGN